MRKFAVVWLAVAVLIVMSSFSNVGLSNQLSACTPSCGGVVDKAPGEAFTVEIVFKNTGSTVGNWSVNVAFEGEEWMWKGTPQNLTLNASKSKTLTWRGNVPEDAPIDTVARLVVYYGNSFVALNWWIHVVPAAELTITSSTVK